MNDPDSQISLYAKHLLINKVDNLNIKYIFYIKNIIYTSMFGHSFIHYYFDNNNIKQNIYSNNNKIDFNHDATQYSLLFLPAENWNLKLKYDQEKNEYDKVIQHYYNKFPIYNGPIVDGTYYANTTTNFCLFQIKNNITNIIYGKCHCNIDKYYAKYPININTILFFIEKKWIRKIDYLLLPNFNITVNSD